jgi:hypothetical protein
MTSVRITPLARHTGLTTLKSFEFCLLRVTPVALIEVFADLAANDAANDGAGYRRRDVAATLTELIADKSASDAAKNQTRVLIVYAALAIAASGQHGNRQ